MNNDLTIVTAASSNHFAPLVNLLWTAARFEPRTRVVVWDVGLAPAERAWLDSDVPPFSWRGEVRTFDFAAHPPHFGMERNAGRLAWRPVSVLGALEEFGGKVLWLDAGCWVTSKLSRVRSNVARDGVHARSCAGAVGAHLHPSSHAALGASGDGLKINMKDAGVAGFDASNARSMALARRWARAALDPTAVDPPGANRTAHRQDAVFAALFHAEGFRHDSSHVGEVITKRDAVSHAEMRFSVSPGRSYQTPLDWRSPRASDEFARGYARAIKAAARRI